MPPVVASFGVSAAASAAGKHHVLLVGSLLGAIRMRLGRVAVTMTMR